MKIIQYSSSLSCILPIIIGILFFRRHSDFLAKPFLIYLIVVSIFESICLYQSIHFINNHLLYNCIDLITIAFFVFVCFINGHRGIGVLSIIIFVIASFNVLAFDLNTFKQNNYLLIYSYIGLYSIIQLFKATKLEEGISINNFRFWFYNGYIISTFSSISMYIFFNKIVNLNTSHTLVQYYTFFTFVISTLQYTSFSIAFTCKK